MVTRLKIDHGYKQGGSNLKRYKFLTKCKEPQKDESKVQYVCDIDRDCYQRGLLTCMVAIQNGV